MNDPAPWSLDRDPPRDESLGRLLRAVEGTPPGAAVDWERLHAAVMRGAARQWWDVVVQWARFAAVASVAAMLVSVMLLWRSGPDPAELTLGADVAPESVALARVVAAYPDDAVLSTLLQTVRNDEFISWSAQ